MARTYRDRKNDFDRSDPFLKHMRPSLSKGGRKKMDKDIQQLGGNKSFRTDGISVRPDWDDERGGHTRGKAERLAGKNAIVEGLSDMEVDAEDESRDLQAQFEEAYGPGGHLPDPDYD